MNIAVAFVTSLGDRELVWASMKSNLAGSAAGRQPGGREPGGQVADCRLSGFCGVWYRAYALVS